MQYEDIKDVTAAIDGTKGLSQATQDALADLLDGLKPDQVFVPDGALTDATAIAAGTALVIMGANQDADVVFANSSPVKGIVLNGGNNTVTFATSDDVVVSIGATDQGGTSVVTTGAGNDTIGMQGGDATINTGAGDDTVAITGGNANITAGNGDLKVIIEKGATGTATIDAGDGFDVVQMEGGASAHTFGYANGMFTMESDFEVKMTDVNVVTFGNAYADGTVDAPYTSATLLAANPAQSMIGRLYQIALDRDDGGLDAASSADGQLGGINFWLDSAGACITQQLVYSFLNCPEFHNKYDNLSDQDYVETLFANMGLSANDTVGGMSVADYVMSIATNTTPFGGRYDVAWALATSDAADQFIGNDGQKYVIDAGDFSMDNPLA